MRNDSYSWLALGRSLTSSIRRGSLARTGGPGPGSRLAPRSLTGDDRAAVAGATAAMREGAPTAAMDPLGSVAQTGIDGRHPPIRFTAMWTSSNHTVPALS